MSKNHMSFNLPVNPKLEVFYSQAKNDYKGCILCVHGICHGAWCFENFLTFFSDNGYDCYALSFRGHAGSAGQDKLNEYSLSDYSDDIKKCIEYCKSEKCEYKMKSNPFLLGHSMGGAVVQKYIGEHSNTINGAILFAPATAGGMGLIEQIKPIFCSGLKDGFMILNLINKNKHVPTAVMGKSAFFNNRVSKEKIEYYNGLLHNESKVAIKELGKSYTDNYNKDDIPILVIGSYADSYFPEKSLEKTASMYRCTKNDTKRHLEILPDLCHDMMLDPDWKKSAKAVFNFMENNRSA